jgi:hypothetical protein
MDASNGIKGFTDFLAAAPFAPLNEDMREEKLQFHRAVEFSR